MFKVLATDNVSQTGLKLLAEEKRVGLDIRPPLPREQLKQSIGAYHAIIIRSATTLDRELLDHAQNLQLIIRAGIGVDNIDVDAATEKGILVANTPRGNATTTAEHTMAMISSLARHIPQAHFKMKQGEWEKKKFLGTELKGKTIGLIGLGNIGAIVAKIAQGYTMQVLAYDPYVPEAVAQQLGAHKVELDDLLKQSDIITIHAPLNENTRHLINENAFAKMKSTVLLVNCARGGIVNETDLAKALKSKRIAGAAVDVFEQEPIPENHPFFELDNLIMTPHLGASTVEAQEGVTVDASLLVLEYLKYKTVSSAINSGLKFKEVSDKHRSFIQLSEKLGSLAGQLAEGVPLEFVTETVGESLSDVRDHIQIYAAMAFMKTMLAGEKINPVNVKYYARKRNLSLVNSEFNGDTEKMGYHQLIRIRVKVESAGKMKEYSVAGTLFSKTKFVVTEIDGYYFDLPPEGIWLLIYNQDKPGVIGKIGTILGKHQINISRMSVNLRPGSRDALAVYKVDTPVGPNVIKEINSWESIHFCKQVKL
jgi:D-3-phosphoglycerate dehydrogenase